MPTDAPAAVGRRPRFGEKATHWRVEIFGQPVAPWRRTRALAESDAIDLGHASRDPRSKTLYMTVPAEIAAGILLAIV